MLHNGTILALNVHWWLVLDEDQHTIFFLHKTDVKAGREKIAVGVPLTFEPQPPFPGKKYPRAVAAVIGGVSYNGGRQ